MIKMTSLMLLIVPLAIIKGQELYHVPYLGKNDKNVIFNHINFSKIKITYPEYMVSVSSPKFLPLHVFAEPVDSFILFRLEYEKPYYIKRELLYSDEREYYYYQRDSNIIKELNIYDNYIPLFFDRNKLVIYDSINHSIFGVTSSRSIESYFINPCFLEYLINFKKCVYSPNKQNLLVCKEQFGRSDEVFIINSSGLKSYLSADCKFAYWLNDSIILYSNSVCNDERLFNVTLYCIKTYNINTQEHKEIKSKWITNIYFTNINNNDFQLYGERYGLPISRMSLNKSMSEIDFYYPYERIKAGVNYFYPLTSGDFVGFLLLGHFPKFYLFKKLGSTANSVKRGLIFR